MKNNLKKLVSLVMVVAMLGASFVVVNAADPVMTGPNQSWTLLYSQDFEDAADKTFTERSVYGTINTKITRDQIDGTYASHIKGSNTSTTEGHATYSWITSHKTIGAVDNGLLGIDQGCVAQFDVYKVSGGLPITAYWRSKYLDITNAVLLPTSNFPVNNRWYTVTIEASGNYWRDNYANGKVYVSIKDNVTGVVVPGTYHKSYTPVSGESCFGFVCDARVAGNANAAKFDDLGYIEGTGTALENAAATDYYIDNVKLYNRTNVVTTGVNLYLDWDSLRGEGSPAFTTAVADTRHSIVAEANGNTYRTFEALTNTNQCMNFAANGDKTEMLNGDFTISMDVVKLVEGDSLQVGYNSGVVDPSVTTKTAVYTYGFGIPACTVDKDVWYSYRIVRKDGVMTAYRKTRDGNDSFVEVGVETATNTKYSVKYGTRIPVLYLGNSYTNTSNAVSHSNNSLWLYCPKNKPVNRPALGCTGEETVAGTKWGYDNLVVTEGNAMTVESINVGLDANSRATKLSLKTAEKVSEILPMIGYYDASKCLKFAEYSKVVPDATDVSSGWYVVERDSDDYTESLGANGIARAFIWDSLARPLVTDRDVTTVVK